MATTVMSSANNSTVKRWELKTWVEAYKQSAFGTLARLGALYDVKDFRGRNNRGDTMTFNYVGKLTGVPLGEGQTSFGNEERLDINSHSMAMNTTRIPVSNPNEGMIEQQRTNINFDEVTANVLAGRAAELIDNSLFQQLAGVDPNTVTLDGTLYNTAAAKSHIQGHNSIVAPTTNRIIRAGGALTDQALGSSDTMNLDLVDFAIEKILTNDQPIAPLTGGMYALFLSWEQCTDLKHDAGSKISWYQNALSSIEGGEKDALNFTLDLLKPVAVGEYGNVKIFATPRVAYGANASTSDVITTVRRAVLVGRDAASFASPFGGIDLNGSGVPFRLYVQLSDYEAVKGMDLRSIYGLKKMSPSNKEDLGSFVISTYAAAHA